MKINDILNVNQNTFLARCLAKDETKSKTYGSRFKSAYLILEYITSGAKFFIQEDALHSNPDCYYVKLNDNFFLSNGTPHFITTNPDDIFFFPIEDFSSPEKVLKVLDTKFKQALAQCDLKVQVIPLNTKECSRIYSKTSKLLLKFIQKILNLKHICGNQQIQLNDINYRFAQKLFLKGFTKQEVDSTKKEFSLNQVIQTFLRNQKSIYKFCNDLSQNKIQKFFDMCKKWCIGKYEFNNDQIECFQRLSKDISPQFFQKICQNSFPSGAQVRGISQYLTELTYKPLTSSIHNCIQYVVSFNQ